MDKITKSLLETFSSQNEIERLAESVQFEHFSNYSIISKLNRSSFELDDIHTGSGGDCAIDGLCVVANGRIITDIDELNEITEGPGYLDAEIIFIQAKTTSSFAGRDIGSFIHGVKDFLSDNPKLVQNERIKNIKAIWDEVINKSSYMINRRPHCKLFYACTGKWVGDQNLQAIIDGGIAEIESLEVFENVSITPIGATDIQRFYHETKNKLSTTINFQNRITLPDIDDVKEAYLGVIPFNEFAKLIQDENQTIHSIFDDNVRDFQGENAVKKRIKNTLSDGRFDLFCVLNNGVTLVATSITPAGNRFTLRDYQIVNGCQTSNILHECQNIDGISNVSVPIKIIVTESEDIKTEITLATNSQTEVRTEQLEALSQFQKRLELYYNAEQGDIKLHYERRSQQYNSTPKIKRTQIISIPIQIKSFASVFLESPHLVSGYYGTIVNRFKGQIFADNHKLLPYYVSSLCYYRIEQYFRSGELSPEYKKARFHIMMAVRMLSMECRIDQLNSNAIEKKCEAFKVLLLDDKKALKAFNQAIQVFEK
ncbi:AIPR family protein [Acidithiobacillus ferridurans]|uniref:AIPR family protein n=1 Tax=Acidithiobacillus ferridurans TaxID=1232575 RepID=UPI001C0789AD|nr:AIPR family protein [Acidithiobacillus ferridurans]MBU2805206.1 AIPR family protein [Acidithiobacillus ferridurans]